MRLWKNDQFCHFQSNSSFDISWTPQADRIYIPTTQLESELSENVAIRKLSFQMQPQRGRFCCKEPENSLGGGVRSLWREWEVWTEIIMNKKDQVSFSF